MTSRTSPLSHSPDTPTPYDHQLREALARLPRPADTATTEGLQQRALAAWHSTVGTPPRRGGWAAGVLQRRWMLGGAGLAMGMLAVGLWVTRPDPVLQELLQPDVLSQIAADQF